MMPLVVVTGRPNVGKSTLFNRLVGGRPALVHNTAGLTRDRKYGDVELGGKYFRLVDTGGLDPDAESEVIGAGIHRQARAALNEADLILFVVDGKNGLSAQDRELAVDLRRFGKPTALVVNKVDGVRHDIVVHEFHELGLSKLFSISAAHGRGIDPLCDWLEETLPLSASPDEIKEDDNIRVAFAGKPNAGKSSMVNRLVGAERSLVHDQPGTTTDPVDCDFSFDGHGFTLVDTAGIRRKSKVPVGTEKLSAILALGQIRRADVTVLVVDVKEGCSEQDARIASSVEKSGTAVVVALNKVDLFTSPEERKEAVEKAKDELRFLRYARFHVCSAVRGDGIEQLMDLVVEASVQYRRHVATSDLNRFFEEVLETHPPPIHRGKAVRIHYITQGGIRPPTFLLFANKPKGLSPSYKRYVVNQLRVRYGFRGSPVRLFVKPKALGTKYVLRGGKKLLAKKPGQPTASGPLKVGQGAAANAGSDKSSKRTSSAER